MRMKKSGRNRVIVTGLLFAAAAAFIMLCPQVVTAHSPGSVKLDYNMSTQTLSVSITHTRFSDSHYIDKVEIKKNGNLVTVQEYKNQADETVTYFYKVTAGGGDTLEVKASCNKFGSKTETLKVGQPGKSAPI